MKRHTYTKNLKKQGSSVFSKELLVGNIIMIPTSNAVT